MVPIEARDDANTGCDAIPRTETALHTQANPDIAGTNVFPFPGGFTSPSFSPSAPMSNAVYFPPSDMNAKQMGGARRLYRKTHRHRRGGPCPVCSQRKQRGGGCGCMQRGGGSPQGLAQFPDVFALSGGGPNVGNPVNMQSGCDPRAGSPEDPHAPINMVQRGGSYFSLSSAAPLDTAYTSTPPPSYGTANAFAESCYKAPGSELPVYNNNSAAFNFRPSLVENNSLAPGVNVYNDVIQQPGRMGPPVQTGGRRDTRKNRKGSRKGNRKGNRKGKSRN